MFSMKYTCPLCSSDQQSRTDRLYLCTFGWGCRCNNNRRRCWRNFGRIRNHLSRYWGTRWYPGNCNRLAGSLLGRRKREIRSWFCTCFSSIFWYTNFFVYKSILNFPYIHIASLAKSAASIHLATLRPCPRNWSSSRQMTCIVRMSQDNISLRSHNRTLGSYTGHRKKDGLCSFGKWLILSKFEESKISKTYSDARTKKSSHYRWKLALQALLNHHRNRTRENFQQFTAQHGGLAKRFSETEIINYHLFIFILYQRNRISVQIRRCS